MGPRISMINYETSDKAASKAGLSYPIENHDSVNGIYEAGMIDVLREIAVTKLYEVEDGESIELPDEYRVQVEKHAAALQEIKKHLPEKYHSLVSAMEDAQCRITGLEMDDYFIRGFVEGYRFLRTLNSSYRGESINVRR